MTIDLNLHCIASISLAEVRHFSRDHDTGAFNTRKLTVAFTDGSEQAIGLFSADEAALTLPEHEQSAKCKRDGITGLAVDLGLIAGTSAAVKGGM